MRAHDREHPLGTPGASALRKGRQAASARFVGRLLPGLVPEGASWRKGAAGERKVARRLGSLPKDEWMQLHDRPLGPNGRNVDHLVIGTGGVYSINTKNLSGRVVVKKTHLAVNGYRDYPVVHTARNEGGQVGARLSAAVGAVVEVTPVIVVLAESFEVVDQPDGVGVLALHDVPTWFLSRPRTLGIAEASRIYRASRKNDVWIAPIQALGRLRRQGSP
jgi:hypothetical protein